MDKRLLGVLLLVDLLQVSCGAASLAVLDLWIFQSQATAFSLLKILNSLLRILALWIN